MFDIGLGEVIIIGVIGLIIFGPEKLPTFAAQVGRFFRQMREMAGKAKKEVVNIVDIDPKSMSGLSKKLLGEDEHSKAQATIHQNNVDEQNEYYRKKTDINYKNIT